jgi:hypothetical protein
MRPALCLAPGNAALRYDVRYGSLQAKITLVSSTNMTECAMTLNMVMGLLIQGGPLPA